LWSAIKRYNLERPYYVAQKESRAVQLSTFIKEHRLRVNPDSRTLGSWDRLPSRRGKPVTQEEVAESIGVSRVWYATLESQASVRASPALLDRLATALTLTTDERASLFNLALPELKLETASASSATAFAPMMTLPKHIEDAARAFSRMRERYLDIGSADDSVLRPRIINSWNRCRTSEVNPNKQHAPRCTDIYERRDANERLLRAAEDIVSYLAGQFDDRGYVIFVSDPDGNLLKTVGSLSDLRKFSRHGIEEGCDLSEAGFGTNAIGTAIADQRPMQLLAGEHFCEGATWFTCSAAPIFVPGQRETAGVIDLSACYQVARPEALGVVMHAALEIEERLASL
jgi:transcriptional regulator with XRE-family HTH domain